MGDKSAMTEAEKMLLDDAIEASIEAEKDNVSLRKELGNGYVMLAVSLILNIVLMLMIIGG